MTATRALILFMTVVVAAAVTRVSGTAGALGGSSVRLKTISARLSAKGASLVIEATEPVPYVATRPDALTVLVDLRNVATEGVTNRVSANAKSPIAGVVVEAVPGTDDGDSTGSSVSRLRISLTQAVAHHVRSERNNIVVDFDKEPDKGLMSASPAGARQAPDAMQALAQVRVSDLDPIVALGLGLSAPAPVRPGGDAARMLASAQLQPPAAPGGAPAQGPSRYSGTPVNFDLEDADLRSTLLLFQQVSGLNMIIDPGIQGRVTTVLRDVPWDQALDLILKQNKLTYLVEGSVVRVMTQSAFDAELDQRRKSAEAQALAGDLVVMTKTLSYATAADLQNLLKTQLSTRGTVQIDPRTNTLIITDLQDRLATVQTLIGTLDRAQPQVEIEARIVQTNKDYARQLGVRWGFNGRVDPALGNTTNLAFPNNGSLSGRVGGTQGPNGASTAVNLGVPANSAVGLALGSVNGSFNLDVELSALERSGDVRLLSTPKVSTLNNVEAEIAQGVQVPYQTTANNTVVTNFKDAALVLKVLPQITEAGTVIMKISVDKGSVGEIFPGGVSINTQRANTTVLVNDGETTVIGGIFEGNDRSSSDKTPGLSRVPLLGWLFKNELMSEQNTELLIFITPRIIR